MKRLIVVVFVFVFCVLTAIPSIAEEIRSGLYEFDLAINGSMSDKNGTSTFVVGGAEYLDMSDVKPNLGVFALQVYRVDRGDRCAGQVAFMATGVTYTITYTTSINKDTWSSGTTNIVGPLAVNAGNTSEVVPFYPEFAKYYKFQIAAGITQFGVFKAKLLVQ